MLKELDLSGNSFTTFPAVLPVFVNLKRLRLSNCKKLTEIPDLPPNIKRLEARDCELLQKCSQLEKGMWPARLRIVDFCNCYVLAKNLGMNLEIALLSEAFHKKFQVGFFLPGSKILEWVSYTGEQGFLTFIISSYMFRLIQGVVLCIILCLEDGVTANRSCEMFVDGQSMISCSRQLTPLQSDHLWLYYQPFHHIATCPDEVYSVRFEISFELLRALKGSALKMCGVHLVYKQEKMVNDPSSTQSKSRTESVLFDLMRSSYKSEPDLNLNLNTERNGQPHQI